ncbi:MAG: NfeD family protein [Tetrasphaera jenkinsii]|jgi:membrane protein implicated in regulation of membrane protease activity|uniref:Putative integral membrane protein n=1 Tax=Nostocoides jenkinsii Ben 74 TaxID=1193518 RepID=A0A077M335_9MICO|nr:NfeD family protein [Tetrasphaera jenkinsii]MCI1262891.1 NfeD family protein [Tetrasphaera jenkinsii]CCI51606.1 putative integral membrane protein [Tetrasphaera jenkinsii Ben 74]
MQWLSDNPWLGWLGLAIALAAVEAATVDFVFVMLAAGALAGALVAAFGAPFAAQVITAAVVGVLFVLFVRPLARSRFLDTVTDHGIGSSALVGRGAQVVETVTARDGGRVKLAGDIWSARTADGSLPCEPGQEVRVVSIEGATVIVSPVPSLPQDAID